MRCLAAHHHGHHCWAAGAKHLEVSAELWAGVCGLPHGAVCVEVDGQAVGNMDAGPERPLLAQVSILWRQSFLCDTCVGVPFQPLPRLPNAGHTVPGV